MLSVSARVIAPIDGIVTGRNYHVGAVVRTGASGESEPLLTIVQTSRVRIVVEVPDRDAVFLDKGAPATFRPDALPDRAYKGTISRTAVAEDKGTLRAEIDLDNSDGRLRPGQAGHVAIALADHSEGLTIPVSAVLEDGDGPQARDSQSCYRVKEGRTVRTPIRLGQLIPDASMDEVIGGLGEGDTIVADWRGVDDQDGVNALGSVSFSGTYQGH
ncbi:MAG: efflux RND transporter periplasmic adaptor subunit [Isosphaeraceae bacterium]